MEIVSTEWIRHPPNSSDLFLSFAFPFARLSAVHAHQNKGTLLFEQSRFQSITALREGLAVEPSGDWKVPQLSL